MITQVASFTSANIYDVTIEKGIAVRCSCKNHQYRGVVCKHQIAKQVELNAAKSATFASLMKAYDYRQPRYSLVCNHLVKSSIYRSCGCDA